MYLTLMLMSNIVRPRLLSCVLPKMLWQMLDASTNKIISKLDTKATGDNLMLGAPNSYVQSQEMLNQIFMWE